MPVLFNNQTGLAENMDQGSADSALAAGTHQVPIISPDGETGSIPPNQVQVALAQGYRQPKPEELQNALDYAQYSTPVEEAKSVASGAAKTLTMGLSSALEDPQAAAMREKVNPGLQTLGGVGALLVPGLGEVGGAGLIGEAGETAAGLASGPFMKTVLKGAGEMGAFAVPDEVGKWIQNDPNQSAASAASNIGLSALLGGAFSAPFGAIGTLAESKLGQSAGQILEDMKGRYLEKSTTLSDPIESMAQELQGEHDALSGAVSSGLQDSDNTAAQILGGSADYSKAETGDLLKNSLAQRSEAAYAPVKDLYSEINDMAPGIPISDKSTGSIARNILNIAEDKGLIQGTDRYNFVQNMATGLDQVDNLQKLANFRTELWKNAGPTTYDLAGQISEKLDNLEENTIKRVSSTMKTPAAKTKVNGLIDQLDQAKSGYKAWKSNASELGEILGKGKIYGPADYSNFLSDITPEKVTDRLFSKKNSGFLNTFSEKYPEEFQLLKNYQRGGIYDAASKSGKFDLPTALNKINSLEPEIQKSLFSPEELSTLKRLQSSAPAKAIEEFEPTLNNLRSQFFNKIGDSWQVDRGKIANFLRKESGPAADKGTQVLQSLMDNSKKLREAIPAQQMPLNVTARSMEKLSTGQKIMDYMLNKGVSRLAGETIGGGIGGLAGSTVGHPVLGALVGEHALSPIVSSIMPMMMKPLVSNAASARAFRSAVDFGVAAAKGETMLNKAAKAVFSRDALPAQAAPDPKGRQKLKDRVAELTEDPRGMENLAGDTGHYLPDHAGAIGQVASRGVSYLASIRPKTDPLGPMDPDRIPPKSEEAAYNRALDIAENPVSILGHVQSGMLTNQDLKTMAAIYPEYLQRMQSKLMEQSIAHTSKDKIVPYGTKLAMAKFMGQPMDASMTPQSIQALQMKPPIAAPQPQPKKTTKSAADGLTKLASMSQTPGQARESSKIASQA